jgi:hypothetical protein
MTLFSRKTLMASLATASLALAGAALTSAPAMAGGWHGGHGFHKGGFHKGGFHKGFFFKKKHYWYGKKFGYGYGYPSYFASGYGADLKGFKGKSFDAPEVKKSITPGDMKTEAPETK